MAVSVVNSSVKTVEVLFPGSVDELWYRIDRNIMKPEIYHGRQVEAVEVDIRTVRISITNFTIFAFLRTPINSYSIQNINFPKLVSKKCLHKNISKPETEENKIKKKCVCIQK